MLHRKNSKLNTWQTHETQAAGHTHWMKDGTQNVLIVAALQNNLNISLKQSRLREKLGFCSKRLWCFTTICFSTKSWALKKSKGDEERRLSRARCPPPPLGFPRGMRTTANAQGVLKTALLTIFKTSDQSSFLLKAKETYHVRKHFNFL